MLGDDGRHGWQFGDLMPGRFGVVGAGLDRQGTMATGTGLGPVVLDEVDALGRQASAVMPAMAGLAAGPASGRWPARWFGGMERVGRGWQRAVGGVLLELEEQFVDLSFEPGDPSQGGVELLLQLDTPGALRAGLGRKGIHGG